MQRRDLQRKESLNAQDAIANTIAFSIPINLFRSKLIMLSKVLSLKHKKNSRFFAKIIQEYVHNFTAVTIEHFIAMIV